MRFRKNQADVPNAQNQIQLFPILLINFIGTLGFSIVLPFLVILVKDFGGNAIVFGICAATEDKKEGTQAFLQKRPAKFKGK